MLKIVCQNAVKFFKSNNKQIEEALNKYYKKNELIPGYCKAEQTQRFANIDSKVKSDYWRTPRFINENFKVSSLGIGTQGGEPTPESDAKMFQVLLQSIKSGRINFIDTDANFRYGKSQKTINAVINHLVTDYKMSRESLFISTKCGYIPNDIDSNLDQKKIIKILTQQGLIKQQDIVNEIHSLHPNFIQFSLQKSMISLGVSTIDLLYLNNPAQSQQTIIGKQKYHEKLEKAFQTLQTFRTQNKIRYYGIASFISFRSPPNQQGIHSNICQVVDIARKIGGKNHGLKFILVPFNLGMPQILTKWQTSSRKTQQNIFTIAEQCQLNINFCCPLYQGRVANLPFKSTLLNNFSSNSAKHLQLIRSIPKKTVLSTIFSTMKVDHLKENLQTANFPCLTEDQWKQVLPI